ncbi:MAG: FAD-binding oxidoreductase [Pseudomonadota bacterium]
MRSKIDPLLCRADVRHGLTEDSPQVSEAFVSRSDIFSWGRVTRQMQRVATPRFVDQLPALIDAAKESSLLAVGLRRSYGDSCLNELGDLIDMSRLDRIIAFDPLNGILRAEAGVGFSEILQLIVPHGWFLPVTPGTRFVTLGGAIANDIHGKNHHAAGSFGRHVRALGLLRSDRGRLTLTPESDPALFTSTIGGLGLSGIIEWAEISLTKIESAYLEVDTRAFETLDDFWDLAETSAEKFTHTIAWVDGLAHGEGLGRGIFWRANWSPYGFFDAPRDQTRLRVPADAPDFLLSRLSIGAFNTLYHRLQARAGTRLRHYLRFFYPLDTIGDWNRLYGRDGLLQYQCVVPRTAEREAIRTLLETVAADRQASFLAMLKTFGDLPAPGLLSFARAGTTLALDFPNRGEKTRALLARLDAIVADAGGALYPAKDGRMSHSMFRRSFPRWQDLQRDPLMSSDFWRRVAA